MNKKSLAYYSALALTLLSVPEYGRSVPYTRKEIKSAKEQCLLQLEAQAKRDRKRAKHINDTAKSKRCNYHGN